MAASKPNLSLDSSPLLESFAFSELMKQATWLDEACSFYHYRDTDKDEVDVVIENHARLLLGIEVGACQATCRVNHAAI